MLLHAATAAAPHNLKRCSLSIAPRRRETKWLLESQQRKTKTTVSEGNEATAQRNSGSAATQQHQHSGAISRARGVSGMHRFDSPRLGSSDGDATRLVQLRQYDAISIAALMCQTDRAAALRVAQSNTRAAISAIPSLEGDSTRLDAVAQATDAIQGAALCAVPLQR